MTHIQSILVALLAAPVLAVVPSSPADAACYGTTLRQGMRGTCVLQVQRRLAAMRYDIGTPDGAYGSSTYHAVVAFQKIQGLTRTGVVNAATWYRLYNATVQPRLHYIRSGSGLEVSISRQVMFRADRGVIAKIYSVSTGRASLPTPISNWNAFRIWKRALWGTTGYNDMEHYVHYFYPRTLLAIHAYSFVPPYPASHGCIRVPPASAARLWPTTYVGERLFTYR